MAKKRGDGGRKHGDDVVMVTGTIRGGIQHWDKQTNVIQKPKHGIFVWNMSLTVVKVSGVGRSGANRN